MLDSVGKLDKYKEKIISFLNSRGPSLPIEIAKNLGVSTIFASAFLSELFNEKKIKMSTMRVGSSPLYYLSGQEKQLENFIQYLNQREREAFYLISQQKVLMDEKQPPVVRVALRAINDFAIPIKVKRGESAVLFWRYHLCSEDEVIELASRLLEGEQKKEFAKDNSIEESAVFQTKEIYSLVPKDEQKIQKEVEVSADSSKASFELETQKEFEKKEVKKKIVKSLVKEESDFAKKVKKHILGKNFEFVKILSEKKRELVAVVSVETFFGKQDFLLVAKDKKTVSDNDLALAHQSAQNEKMPCLFVSPGELNNRAKEHLKAWRNLIKLEKIDF